MISLPPAPAPPLSQCTWAIRADKNMLMNQLIVSLKCRSHFSCISSSILCISDLITPPVLDSYWIKSSFKIVKFIAHKINHLTDISKY